MTLHTYLLFRVFTFLSKKNSISHAYFHPFGTNLVIYYKIRLKKGNKSLPKREVGLLNCCNHIVSCIILHQPTDKDFFTSKTPLRYLKNWLLFEFCQVCNSQQLKTIYYVSNLKKQIKITVWKRKKDPGGCLGFTS